MDDDEVEPANKEYKSARPQALESDKNTCRFCQHHQPGHMQVHHLNCNHKDNAAENLATVCFICHANHHIWLAGKSKTNTGLSGNQDGSYLIYLPNIEQGLLNRFLMSCFAAKQSKNKETKEKAIAALEQLSLLRKPVEETFALSSAQAFGSMLADLPESTYEFRSEILSGLKMVMTEDSFMYDGIAVSELYKSWQKLMPENTWNDAMDRIFKVDHI